MFVQGFFDEATFTITYLVADEDSGEAVIIDPVTEYDAGRAKLASTPIDLVLDVAADKGFRITRVLDTHAHADHLSAADYVRRKTGARYGIGARITEVQTVFKTLFNAKDVNTNGVVFDDLFADGETFKVGNLDAKVIATPGHTPACVTYVIGDAAFVGDTMFMPDYGTARTDFPGGDAGTLYDSIQQILSLPEETRIFVGHDYLPEGRTEYVWETTVAEQKAKNIHVHDGISREQFIEMRNTRDAKLAPPRLIMPSLQVNIRAGQLPPAEDNGKQYIKIPVSLAG
ncbi:MBL fold metallo-hydrolase [Ponticaulis sp.]|uniref:MBL fold metallo-hydrolase n=1 Tax=Ponticaulis sp. TaxID=2020902 RepID=UPI000B73DD10|nr:MBL fold metallo-hydrolase [Ponticaulis sp.]MAJ09828.1 MBL fold metallo-hydrolase [Ponticaulis sp.]RPG17162.1 MAG: MBL fold metallo-hydrolase [Hyphomonadaceae bacterium TMED125]HBH90657.1 MBL fold metallo-hydrolase [Hyphomonadaceae bacterium]HBJ93625.1 MBL fold metallo-hydrolase [Hyphomonadaceae bacterium]|tara:strand:- start:13449 stop:14306 length:858 start_codon:yes stop_codon:yes gene_type:complete